MIRSTELVELLINEGANATAIDVDGQSPITLYLKGSKGAQYRLYSPLTGISEDRILTLLIDKGADINQLYFEDSFEPAFDLKRSGYGKQYKTTILINMVRQLLKKGEVDQTNLLINNLQGLLRKGALFKQLDSDGRDALAYAIMANNSEVLQLIFANQTIGKLLKNNQDLTGKSLAHLVVNPCKLGSYESESIMRDLHKHG